ncbi:catalase family peroxidase [Paenibacillus wulumuqiensis]|uniref:catalase family peroxidase n=1 Tax=Paenibacillus wulumuqiensis TaxID=1567107 RepID=UPI000619A999|nr:catalase family peroxidase [Paenibacillus wulumuqiensis]
MHNSHSSSDAAGPYRSTGEDPRDLDVQAVDEIEKLTGRHPGYRRAHAKGTCYHAAFQPSGEAAAWTTAPHLQGPQVEALVRFSESSTDPALADLLSPAKGMAVQFRLPEGKVSNLVAVTVPVFFARTPESFMDMLKAVNKARAGNLGIKEIIHQITGHFGEARESLLSVQRLRPPTSYVTNLYYCIHAYLLVNEAGQRQPVKFEWLPEAGVHMLSIKDTTSQPPDYLERELNERLQQQTAAFRLNIIIGEEGDPTDDPTTAWPKKRQRIDAGRLVLTAPVAEPEGLVMDPTVLPPQGMELSDDPILNFRRAAYAESWKRRSGEAASGVDTE